MSENDTAGPHEIPGLPPCICSSCSAHRAGTAAAAKARVAGKAAAARELAEYKQRLAQAMASLEPADGKMMILPDTPVYGVTGPSLSGGSPPGSWVRVAEISPGMWRPDPAGTMSVWVPVPVVDEPAAIRIPQAPMPDCTCQHPQDNRWAVHHPECPARRRLVELVKAEAATRYWQDRERVAAAGKDRDDPPESPADAWWRELRAIGGSLTYRQMADRVPDQPPGLCMTCRYLPSIPGRVKCADCAEIADARPAVTRKAGEPARPAGGMKTLVTLIALGVACTVLAMSGFTPLIIPGIVLLGCSLSIIFKGEWK